MPARIHPQIETWQREGHEIGMVEFAPTGDVLSRFPHKIPPGLTPVAMWEADVLCVDPVSGELVVFDHEVAGREFCRAASDQTAFVSAMNRVEEHCDRCGADETYRDDETAAANVAEECARLAGGEKFAGFFHSLLGA